MCAGDLLTRNTSLFDADMFKAVWRSVVSAIAYAFITFEDDYIIERAISGFRQCATLARHFDMPDVFDFVVISLSQATSLLSEAQPSQVPNYPVVDIDGQPVTVSSLSVKFGTNFKGQLAAVVLFNIVNGNANALREGWTQVRPVVNHGCVNTNTESSFRSLRCSRHYSCTLSCQRVCFRWKIFLVERPSSPSVAVNPPGQRQDQTVSSPRCHRIS